MCNAQERERERERGEKKRREGGERVNERQLEKIYPRVVEGSDIRVPQLAAVGFDARSPRWKGWTDGPQPYGRPSGGVQPEWWQGAERRRQGEGCEPASPRVGSARRPMRARRITGSSSMPKRDLSSRGLFRAKMHAFLRISSFFSVSFTPFSRIGERNRGVDFGFDEWRRVSSSMFGHLKDLHDRYVGYYCFSNS